MPCSPLSNSEWEDRALSRQPLDNKDLEACAIEPDGSAVLWNGEGKPVRITQEDREGVAMLLLEAKITVEDTHKMLAGAEQTESLVLRSELIDIIEKLVRFIPRPQQAPILHRLTALKQRGFI